MEKLSYKTIGEGSLQEKARIYFTCHPDDFNMYFETICQDIFETQDCVIWYRSALENSGKVEEPQSKDNTYKPEISGKSKDSSKKRL
ncbi:MAG: hypothetical protein LUE16_06515 [Lachnospiraceae bacterium]|nr:hypothetical protein [Lachnospiraceae bacterium]